MFEVLLDQMRTHSSEWLEARRHEVIGEQRSLHAEELAIVRVLDERGRIDTTIGAHGESARTVREKVDTARALESLPAIAQVALEGGLSDEQLSSVVGVADEASDREWAVSDDQASSLAAQPNVQVAVPLDGPAEIAGIPIADSLLEQLRANATIEPVLVDERGAVLAIGRRTSALSPKVRRGVLLRDAHCRVPGCATRRGLEVHHLVPRSRGGSDDIANLATVCPAHHRLLVPHGVLALIGNPNLPDGLELVTTSRGPPLVPV